MLSEFEAGMRVRIYRDPIVCSDLEGEAVLKVMCIASGHNETEMWRVVFDDGSTGQRRVNKLKH